MIGAEQVKEILAQYEKHGWYLRRVLLSAEAFENLSASSALFGQAEVVRSDTLNAAWFARASTEGRETWELRLLSAAPFALVQVFEANETETTREEIRRAMETRLTEQASKAGSRKSGN